MRKILYIFICLFALTATSCDKYSIFGNSWVTIEYDYEDTYIFKYKDLKVSYNGKEYNSIGRYKVPEGSIVKLEWSWDYEHAGADTWKKASYEVSAIGSMNIVIEGGDAHVTFKNK